MTTFTEQSVLTPNNTSHASQYKQLDLALVAKNNDWTSPEKNNELGIHSNHSYECLAYYILNETSHVPIMYTYLVPWPGMSGMLWLSLGQASPRELMIWFSSWLAGSPGSAAMFLPPAKMASWKPGL